MRDVEDETWGRPRSGSTKKSEKGFYEESESDSDSSSGSDFYTSLSGSDDSGSEDSESDSSGMQICLRGCVQRYLVANIL